jgi:hypothetical protein
MLSNLFFSFPYPLMPWLSTDLRSIFNQHAKIILNKNWVAPSINFWRRFFGQEIRILKLLAFFAGKHALPQRKAVWLIWVSCLHSVGLTIKKEGVETVKESLHRQRLCGCFLGYGRGKVTHPPPKVVLKHELYFKR